MLKKYIPALPSYVSVKEDSVEVSLGVLLAARDFLNNEEMLNPFDYVEDFVVGIPFETYELGLGYSINSFGSIYYLADRIASCRNFNKIFVNYLDFKNYVVSLRLNSEKKLNRSLNLNVPFEVFGLYKDVLEDIFSDVINENGPKVDFDDDDDIDVGGIVDVGDIIDAGGTTKTDDDIEKDFRNFITSKSTLNGEIIDDSNIKNKDFLYLLLLLVLGGGAVGNEPLPKSNNKCAKYLKPERKSIPNDPHVPSFGIYTTKPSGCASEEFNTYHKKMWSVNNPTGSKISIIGLVYSMFKSFYDVNFSNIYFRIYFHIGIKKLLDYTYDKRVRIFPGVAIGSFIENSIIKLQVWTSKEINSFFSNQKIIRLPKLSDDGTGFMFSGYENLTYGTSEFISSKNRTAYEVLQIDLIVRVNFARIFEFVYNEKLYTPNEDNNLFIKSILEKTVEIYKDTKYKLTNMNKNYVLTYNVAKVFYDRGYHYIYGDNMPDDKYELKITGMSGNTKNQTIKTILESQLNELEECSPKELGLELFNGNAYTKTSFGYVYNL